MTTMSNRAPVWAVGGAGLTALVALIVVLPMAAGGPATTPSMTGSQWAIYGERTLPNGGLLFTVLGHASTVASGGVEFAIPDASGSSPGYVNYLEDHFNTNLVETNTITVVLNVETSASTTAFLGGTEGGSTSSVRIFLQSNLPASTLPNCVGAPGYNEYNYWWSNPTDGGVGAYTFVTGGSGGSVTLSVTLSPSDWSDLCGHFGTTNVGAFDAALAKVTTVGLSFGSGSFFANGMGVDGTTGTATFQLIDFAIV